MNAQFNGTLGSGTDAAGGEGYRSYLLGLLMVILAFNYLDRIALGMVLQDIKIDLDLTDTQLGLLSGIAFALFYSVMGIPIARWADRGDRKVIIAITTTLWSAAVALCATATSFIELLLIRIGVAVGEAGCIPPAHSLIADFFTRAERPRAVSIYMLGMPIALLIGYFAAGWLNEVHGWRTTFIVLGLPGVLLALLAWITVKEPRRSRLAPVKEPLPGTSQISMRDACAILGCSVAFRHLLICFSIWYFFGYGILQWLPTFFIRSHGLETGELGAWLAVIQGGVGGLGVLLGGALAARFAAGNERLQLIACAAAFVVFPLLNAFAFLATDLKAAFGALALASLGNMAQGPILATMQTLVPGHLRATSIALVYLFANFIGMGLGPLAAGALSDALHAWLGEESLRYALVALCPGYFWAAWHLWRASRAVVRELKLKSAEVIPDSAVREMVLSQR